MVRLVHVICLGLLFLAAPAEAAPDKRAFARAFGACADTCVVRFNSGGEVGIFLAAAQAVRAGAKRLVVIDGPCISACVIFADRARSKVCVTRRAKFGFHKAQDIAVAPLRNGMTLYLDLGRSDPPHSRDIARWVKRRGGFPSEGLLVMGAGQATQFWKRCPAARRA